MCLSSHLTDNDNENNDDHVCVCVCVCLRVETLKLRIVNAETGEGMIVSGGKDALCKYWDINE